MTTVVTISPTDQLHAMTQKMLALAEASDWEELAALEQSRLPLFKQIFSQGVSGNVELAREVLAMDEKTQSLAQAEMPVLQQEILLMQNSGKANNAYQSIQDSTSGDD